MRLKPLPVWEDEPPSIVLHAIAEALERGDLSCQALEVFHWKILKKGRLIISYEILTDDEGSET